MNSSSIILDNPVQHLLNLNLLYNAPVSKFNLVDRFHNNHPKSDELAWSVEHPTTAKTTTLQPKTLSVQETTQATIDKLDKKLKNLYIFQKTIKKRTFEAEVRKRQVIRNVYESVVDDSKILNKRCQYSQHLPPSHVSVLPHHHKPTHEPSSSTALNVYDLNKGLSDYSLNTLDQLPPHRNYLVFPNEPYHFHLKHNHTDSSPNTLLSTQAQQIKISSQHQLDQEKLLRMYYREGWVDDFKRKTVGEALQRTHKAFALEQRGELKKRRNSRKGKGLDVRVVRHARDDAVKVVRHEKPIFSLPVGSLNSTRHDDTMDIDELTNNQDDNLIHIVRHSKKECEVYHEQGWVLDTFEESYFIENSKRN